MSKMDQQVAATLITWTMYSYASTSLRKTNELFNVFTPKNKNHDDKINHEADKKKKAAVLIQSTFRSYSVRLYLKNHQARDVAERKDTAMKKAQIDLNSKRRVERLILLDRYHDFLNIMFDYNVDDNLNDVRGCNGDCNDFLDRKDFDYVQRDGGGIIQRHIQIFKEMKMKVEVLFRRISNQNKKSSKNTISTIQPSSASLQLPSLQTRLQDRKTHLTEIIHAIDEQLLFLAKLYLKSRAVTKFKFTQMKENNERWKSIRYAVDYINSKSRLLDGCNDDGKDSDPPYSVVMKDWLTHERNLLILSLVECDKVQESLLDDECKRLENELHLLLSSNDISTSMIGWIRNIEMWEAERFGIQQHVMNRKKKIGSVYRVEEEEEYFTADEANMYLQLIDDNQMKLNRARKFALPQICEEAGDFYYKQEKEMEQEVCFERSNDGAGGNLHPTATVPIKASIKSIHKLPIADNYFWSVMEWMEKFTKNYESLLSTSTEKILQAANNEKKMEHHLKVTQQYVYNRREVLLDGRNNIEGGVATANSLTAAHPNNFTKLKWNIFGTSMKSITKSVTRKANVQLLAASKISNEKVIPAFKQVTKRREDSELKMMMTVVKKTMNKQNSTNAVGVVSLKLTVGQKETLAFSTKNDHHEANGKSFYQKRIDLGNHVETALWVQISSKNSDFITDIYWGHCKEDNVGNDGDGKKEGIDFVRHRLLPCIIYTERDPTKNQIVSSIQITYSNTTESRILKRDYQMIPTQLSEYGLADAHLWVSLSDRSSNNPMIDLSRMKNQLAEYEVMLSNRPDDTLLKGLVTEMERRIEVTKRKENEQRGLSNDHIGYITEFLALNEKDLNGFKKAFKKVDSDKDGLITVDEITSFVQEPNTMVPLIQDCIAISLGGEKLVDKRLSFEQFARAIGTLGMFSFVEMTKCLFCSIDKAGYGIISQRDYYELLGILHPKKEISIASRSLRDTAIPESLSYAFFKDLANKFPKLLFPIFRFQQSIRNLCLGQKWWDRKMRRFAYAKEMVLRENIME